MPNGNPGIYSGQYPPEYERYNSQFGGQIEKVGGQLWDTQTYVSATTLSLTNFFTTRATIDLSNMIVPNQLPAPSAFLIRAVRCVIYRRPQATAEGAAGIFEGAIDDVQQLIYTGVFTFTVGNKQYMQTPLYMLPAGGGITGGVTLGADDETAIDWAQNGVPDPRSVFSLSTPIFLAPQINFSGRIDWAAAITMSNTTNVVIKMVLDGDLLRPVQ